MNAYLAYQTQQMERAKTFAEIRRIEERVHRVAQARPEVQQGSGRASRHPAVAVSRTGSDAFKQAQHCAHVGHGVERRDEVHLRRTGVGEASDDAAVSKRPKQGLCAIHARTLTGA